MTFHRTCECPAGAIDIKASGRRAVPACSTCGALFSLDDHERQRPIEIMRAALVRLSTEIHYSARDKTGEESTRRVQVIAADALRRADES